MPSVRQSVAALLAAATLLATTTAAFAHDFWIRPSTFTPAIDSIVQVDLRIGDDYPGEAFARKGAVIEKFVVLPPAVAATATNAAKPAADSEIPVVGLEGRSPAGAFRTSSPGAYVIVYRGRPSRVELEADKFEAYLLEEGLEKIIEARKKSGTSSAVGKEMFSRCAKSLVITSEGPSTGFDRAAGLRLELIPMTDPAAAKPGEEFKVRLLYEGKPCVGVKVGAHCVEDAAQAVSARTDAQGEVALKLGRGGTWSFNAVEMIAASKEPKANPNGSDWESLWASLSFQVRSGEAASAAPPGNVAK